MEHLLRMVCHTENGDNFDVGNDHSPTSMELCVVEKVAHGKYKLQFDSPSMYKSRGA